MSLINVSYQVATTAYRAKQFLNQITMYPTIACDFETAIKYTTEQLAIWKEELLSPDLTKLERVAIESKLTATALDHPSHIRLTHCSIATSESVGYVFIIDSIPMQNLILNFLNSTNQQQLWHRASYDFRVSQYFTGKFPKNYEDTAVLAKCLLNHVETYKAKVGLKELAGYMYGDWGISKDNFSVEHMYDEKVLKYAATDACATYWLWNYMNTECDTLDKETLNEFNSNGSSPNV